MPERLLNLTKSGLEIGWCHDIKSYKKLIPTLKAYPDAIIITADDDILYPCDMVAQLMAAHRKHPQDICAHRIRRINVKHNCIMPYETWPLSEYRSWFNFKYRRSYKNFFCGCGCCLYPPHSLSSDVLNESKFMSICQHQDDIWFWAMAVLNGRKILPTKKGYNLTAKTMLDVQSVGLWETVNSKLDNPNNRALDKIIQEYPEIKQRLGLK